MVGDIVLSQEHTEMVHTPAPAGKGGQTMGAHNDTLPFAEQVSINSYVTSPSYYREIWRLEGRPVPKEWIKGNRFLSMKEMENNVLIINDRLSKKDGHRTLSRQFLVICKVSLASILGYGRDCMKEI